MYVWMCNEILSKMHGIIIIIIIEPSINKNQEVWTKDPTNRQQHTSSKLQSAKNASLYKSAFAMFNFDLLYLFLDFSSKCMNMMRCRQHLYLICSIYVISFDIKDKKTHVFLRNVNALVWFLENSLFPPFFLKIYLRFIVV